jgi:hypothetical protein
VPTMILVSISICYAIFHFRYFRFRILSFSFHCQASQQASQLKRNHKHSLPGRLVKVKHRYVSSVAQVFPLGDPEGVEVIWLSPV